MKGEGKGERFWDYLKTLLPIDRPSFCVCNYYACFESYIKVSLSFLCFLYFIFSSHLTFFNLLKLFSQSPAFETSLVRSPSF
jgi:hypothetical protein